MLKLHRNNLVEIDRLCDSTSSWRMNPNIGLRAAIGQLWLREPSLEDEIAMEPDL
jgi:hypothetical protein